MRSIVRELSRLTLCVLAGSCFGTWVSAAQPDAEPGIVPAVQHWQGGSGDLVLPASPVIQIEAAEKGAIDAVALQLQGDLADMKVGNASLVFGHEARHGSISLAIEPVPGVPPAHANESYRLIIDDAVRITAATPAGLYYGTRTLLQMLMVHPDRQLPKGTITDYPDYAHRMLMIDVGRKPFPIWVLKDFIRIMAWYKLNELHLHLSDESFGAYSAFRVQSKRFPGLAAKDLSYSWEELRDLQDFAKARGVTITPEIDMPGHALSLTNYWPELRHPKGLIGKDKLDVTNPKTIETMKALLDEMIPLFDAPDFHIGTDEFGIGGNQQEKQQIGEAFRQFINTMNAFVRSKGKNCRIWSGFESMPGTTVPDPSVIVDMWVTHDAKSLIEQGHSVINSADGCTYLVPGAHYYGVNNSFIYQDWEPYRIAGDPAKNPAKDDPHLLGGKLHIWNDHGPSGYTLTEIADLALPSIQVFAEKLWGRKGSPTYRDFQKCAALTAAVPGITILQRDPAVNADGVIFKLEGEKKLSDVNSVVPLPWANNPAPNSEYAQPTATPSRADLEYPWTVSMKVRRDAELGTRGVILSSDLVEICANYSKQTTTKVKAPDGKESDAKETKVGIGIVRAAGDFGKDPYHSNFKHDTDGVLAERLPLNAWVDLTIVGLRHETQCFVNGKLAGRSNNQMACPLKRLGGGAGDSFVGTIKDLTVWNKAMSASEIARAAGLSAPDNVAAGCRVTAFRSDTEHGFTPDLMVDEDSGTRWSSGPGQREGWIIVDLARQQQVSGIRLNFEAAFARKIGVEISDDAASWKRVADGAGNVGTVELPVQPAPARYVRLLLQDPATGWGFSLWELEVLGPPGSRGDCPASMPALRSIGGDKPPRAARSVHLAFPAPLATAFYNEVTVEQSQPGSYFMTCGFQHGYCGIQEKANGKKVVIFSVWDPGPQNDPHSISKDQQCELLYQAPDVTIRRFGGEGTGGQCMWDYDWKTGHAYRFAVRSVAAFGGKTEYAAYFFLEETNAWKHLATFRTFDGPAGGAVRSLYSFIEDFHRDGKSPRQMRRALFGNGWALGQDGTWTPLSNARFSASDAPWEAFDFIDAGISADRFYLQTGGDTITHTPIGSALSCPRDRAAPPQIP